MIKTIPTTVLAFCLLSAPWVSQQAAANGEITDQVNHLHKHIDHYTDELNSLKDTFNAVVDDYAKQDSEDVDTRRLIDAWEEVDFHAAIETQSVPIYAHIWQGIYGIKQGIENKDPVDQVRQIQMQLNQALWQALGAVKLAAQYQQRGLLTEIQIAGNEPVNAADILEDIHSRLDRVVAKYAEQLNQVALDLVHETYMQRFEGVEGELIEHDAELVEDLEKDFNVTLPNALKATNDVAKVRQVVVSMQQKLKRAKQLLVKAQADKKDVF